MSRIIESNILAIVPFAETPDRPHGLDPLLEMVKRTVSSLRRHGLAVEAVGTDRDIATLPQSENLGFGAAVNKAIEVNLDRKCDAFLIANSDLEFPDPRWLDELIEEYDSSYVLSPVTDRTAVPESRQEAASDNPPLFLPQVSAFCWLVPRRIINRIRQRYGFNLFDPAFFAYGEDDLTSAILRKQFGPRPFKVVRRSFVRHLKAQTAKAYGLRGGDPKNLKLLRERKRALGVR